MDVTAGPMVHAKYAEFADLGLEVMVIGPKVALRVKDAAGEVSIYENTPPAFGGSADLSKLSAKASFSIATAKTDGMRIIYLYDKADEYGFGYALNMDWPMGSEWGDTCIPQWLEQGSEAYQSITPPAGS
jgi:hypothetical protein